MRVLASLLALVVVHVAAAQSTTVADLTRAQDAYDRGIALKAEGKAEDARASFADAARLFRHVADEGADNPGLHFNLGNALVQSGELGRGIASYLRAQRLAPHDSAIAANLSTARSDVRTKLSGSADVSFDTTVAWWRVVGARTRALVSLIAWLGFWALVVPAIVGKTLSPALRFARGTALVVAILLGGSVALDRWMPTLRPTGVITTDGVVLRKGNGDGFAPQVEETLTNGVEFRVLERRPQWLRVRLSDGTEGWVRENQAEGV